jgi:glycosyltransferase involved in cell wall biosynthesis
VRIAQIAPLFESVPPKQYGGTERIVSYLTEELVNQGHEVVLFASGDSETSAELVAVWPRSLRTDEKCQDRLALHLVQMEKVLARAHEFDVLHFHLDYLHYPVSKRQSYAHVTTLHGRLDIPELVPLYGEFKEIPIVSISDSQRKPLPWAGWVGTVYHGLPVSLYQPVRTPERYLAFLGRISPEKRVDRAIEIATQLGLRLRIAAKIDAGDQKYFEEEIRPLFSHPLVEYVGEIGDGEKQDFLGNAMALLFPIDWEEPFGLVTIEAMACGTPVIAWRRGSVPEIIEDGINGFIVDTVEQAVRTVSEIASFDRELCRRRFLSRFSATRMAEDYLAIYDRVLSGRFRRVS